MNVKTLFQLFLLPMLSTSLLIFIGCGGDSSIGKSDSDSSSEPGLSTSKQENAEVPPEATKPKSAATSGQDSTTSVEKKSQTTPKSPVNLTPKSTSKSTSKPSGSLTLQPPENSPNQK